MRISYVITVYNKAEYIANVIESLCVENDGIYNTVEYIFVDDGSTDNSVEVIRQGKSLLNGDVKILEQENSGAAKATNIGVEAAKYEWIRLLDGDDIVCKNSTAVMYNVAQQENVDFVIGSYSYFSRDEELIPQIEVVDENNYVVMTQEDCLKRFIKNFSHNSSCMLLSKRLFLTFSGADTRLMSPDYSMALRAVAITDKIVRFRGNVTQMVDEAPGRLSSQIRRSRYDSVMAIYSLAFELMPERRDVSKSVYKRACSRSYRYSKILKNNPLKHFIRYIGSKLYTPSDLKTATYKCLTAYTFNGKPDRPLEWVPGYKDSKN
ncbi:glycosyltransferase family A protein [Kiloniella sp. EL199]|uniref:glycosyltransferase family 2 protein n=1 Tax=Kiloniella sp. EL199 TaxID=2107581 RepID=UPI000EA10164|nr:glycosyltransferase family A protein [Kiloniella sp. EL199]